MEPQEEGEEEEGSGEGVMTPRPLVEILEDQHFVEEEQDYVSICRVSSSLGQA